MCDVLPRLLKQVGMDSFNPNPNQTTCYDCRRWLIGACSAKDLWSGDKTKLILQQQIMKLGFRNNAIDMLICACETLKLCREHPHAFQFRYVIFFAYCCKRSHHQKIEYILLQRFPVILQRCCGNHLEDTLQQNKKKKHKIPIASTGQERL